MVGIELDQDAIAVNLENRSLADFEDCQWDIINGDVLQMSNMFRADVVITNPPFGTKNNSGIDFQFLKIAQTLAKEAIYSLHKTSCREGLERKTKKIGLEGEVVAEMSFDLPKTYRFQKSASKNIKVDLWRFDAST